MIAASHERAGYTGSWSSFRCTGALETVPQTVQTVPQWRGTHSKALKTNNLEPFEHMKNLKNILLVLKFFYF